MAIIPEDFVTYAETIYSKNSGQEEYLRAAASRSYYGCFHLCCEIAKKYSIPPTGKNNRFTHRGLARGLKNYTKNIPYSQITTKEALISQIGTILDQARDIREDADYRELMVFLDIHCADALQKARDIMQHGKSL
ncbi:MAG: hypothetical protein CMF49_05060 [Legionellales bacterium]|nr:hypothetical protein [Legionellales bacterium]|tara:strand:- start:953 stop:1357 length:405 start_codon:yes stop_codon:yes gene_type:complete